MICRNNEVSFAYIQPLVEYVVLASVRHGSSNILASVFLPVLIGTWHSGVMTYPELADLLLGLLSKTMTTLSEYARQSHSADVVGSA